MWWPLLFPLSKFSFKVYSGFLSTIKLKASWRTQTEPCVHQDPGERSSDSTRDTPRLACKCPGVSSRGVGQQWPATGSGALSVAVPTWDLLKEVTIIFITSTRVWPQVSNRERTHPHPSTENWIKDLLNMAQPSEQDPVSPMVSLSHQEEGETPSYPAGLLSFSIREQTEWKPQSQKTNQTDHMDHSLV